MTGSPDDLMAVCVWCKGRLVLRGRGGAVVALWSVPGGLLLCPRCDLGAADPAVTGPLTPEERRRRLLEGGDGR